MNRSPRFAAGAGLASLLAIGMLAGTGRAAPASSSAYPPASLFRNLQLILFNCSRDNTAASCDPARSQADALLDHPRLSSSCKDILWSIREKATIAPANSLERRDRIDRSARDLPLYCRQPASAIGSSSGGATPAPTAPPGGPNR